MANSPPMSPPHHYTLWDPSPPPLYLATVAQKKANHDAAANVDANHTVDDYVRRNTEIKLAHQPDNSLPVHLADRFDLFSLLVQELP